METGGNKYGRDLEQQIKSRVRDKMKNRDLTISILLIFIALCYE